MLDLLSSVFSPGTSKNHSGDVGEIPTTYLVKGEVGFGTVGVLAPQKGKFAEGQSLHI